MKPPKVLIFALPRTGSTSLAQAINAHTQQWCAIEPLAPGPNKRAPIKNEAELSVRMRQIWEQYNAIKHIWHPSGWPFEAGMKLNKCLLSESADKVILLWRRNILRRVVSCELSMQVNIWHVSNSRSLEDFRSRDFKALDVESIQRQLTEEVSFLTQWRTILTECGVEWMEITYEDLLQPNGAQEIEFFKVFRFLEMPKDSPPWPNISAVVDVPNARIHDSSSYRRIPNFREIEEKAGADSTGWLFH